jgi:ribosomal protein L37AE/L43A
MNRDESQEAQVSHLNIRVISRAGEDYPFLFMPSDLFIRSGNYQNMECPNCKSNHVRRSVRHGLKEGLFLRFILRAPFRCLQCGKRFMGFSHNPQFRQHRKHRDLAAFLGFRGSEKKNFSRRMIIILVGCILILMAIYIIFHLAQ